MDINMTDNLKNLKEGNTITVSETPNWSYTKYTRISVSELEKQLKEKVTDLTQRSNELCLVCNQGLYLISTCDHSRCSCYVYLCKTCNFSVSTWAQDY